MDNLIVSEKCSTIRMLAREALRGQWIYGFKGALVHNMMTLVPFITLLWIASQFYFIAMLYLILVMGPLMLGMSIFILSICRNGKQGISQIFYGFERFGQACGLLLLIGCIVFLWSLISFPILAIILATGTPALLPLLFAALVPALIAGFRYSQAFFILADNPGMGIIECMRRSKRLMAGNKMKYFLLQMSFIGWSILANLPQAVISQIFPAVEANSLIAVLLLSVLPGIGQIFLSVYVFTSTAVFYDMMSGNLRPGCITATAEIITQEQLSTGQSFEHNPEQTNELQRHS